MKFAVGVTPSLLNAHSVLPVACREEDAFYARYDWCLNPILPLRDLFRRLQEELDRAPALTASWQRAEARINVYLFACAVACTLDDYLGQPLADLSPIRAHFPKLRLGVTLAERVLDVIQAVRTAATGGQIVRWRRLWDRCVDAACDLLVHESEPGDQRWVECDARVRALCSMRLPARVLERRMTLPAAFRNQDLTHHDIATLARRVATACSRTAQPLVVVGLRTAGAYFAPLLKAQLTACGVPDASWLTIRPKRSLSPSERRRVKRLRRSRAQIVVVDEPPSTGKTLRLTVSLLAQAGVPVDHITVAVPRSPANPDWTLPGHRLVVLDPPDYYKSRLLEPGAIPPLLGAYCGANARFPENARIEALNAQLRAHHQDGFHVRLKRVFEVRDIHPRSDPTSTHVIAKSVGWGWLGYHAYIAATRLAGLVPHMLGLRHGLLFTEWVGDLEADGRSVPDIPVQTLASYVATRARRLRLAEDPCVADLAWGRTGWSEIVNVLRRAYGLYVGRLKIPALHRRLRTLVSPLPTLIDGRMRPEEWVEAGTGAVKADFEHHAFGKTELNVVDPVSDLAYAALAFGLSPERERQLVDAYGRESGDGGVADRILPYKLVHGTIAMEEALSRACRDPSEARHEWNRRYLATRTWLTSQLSRFAASRIPAPAVLAWSKRLFFLDLDGVFDADAFGFPHTSTSGLAALALLRAHDFSVVLHTGRSVEDVRTYCRDYSLPGGVAELGSVIVDAVAHREIRLIDDEVTEQLAACRQALARLPGIFIDPTYECAVRAYRIVDERTVPPPPGQVEELLTQAGLDRLAVSPSAVDVIVLARGVDKGRGLAAARDYLGCTDHPVAAIGDSDRDVPMLAAADFAFAPSGCSSGVRALRDQGRCWIMAAPMQRGLLRAARELARLQPGAASRSLVVEPAPPTPLSGLMDTLLQVTERSRLRQFLGALAWWRL